MVRYKIGIFSNYQKEESCIGENELYVIANRWLQNIYIYKSTKSSPNANILGSDWF